MIEAARAAATRAPFALRHAKRAARAVGLTRGHVAAARMACERHALAVGGRPRQRAGGRVLCYHSVGQRALGVNDVKPARFERQIALALDLGFRFVPASRIAETGGAPNELAITFDDGHRSVLTAAAPVLAAHGVPWSLFVVSGWCETIGADRTASLLTWREIIISTPFGTPELEPLVP